MELKATKDSWVYWVNFEDESVLTVQVSYLLLTLLPLMVYIGYYYFYKHLPLKHKNDKLIRISEEYKEQREKYKVLFHKEQKDYISLALFIERHGGIENIEKNNNKQNKQFNNKEIDTLIRLCHPDKHNGKDSATEITQKLLEIRK